MATNFDWTNADISLNTKELNYIGFNPLPQYDFVVNQLLIRWMKKSNEEQAYKNFQLENNGSKERMHRIGGWT